DPVVADSQAAYADGLRAFQQDHAGFGRLLGGEGKEGEGGDGRSGPVHETHRLLLSVAGGAPP
ncbi:MAG: hypothetical protein MI806_21460, partial [Minwuiales bacterium]|nr:hypothetical protein [Minwuiales bacterium]